MESLHAKFETEWAAQFKRNQQLAKKSSRSGQKSKVANSAQEQFPAVKGRINKKKKRSALANASNPHHLRNYVPSRMPNSGQPPMSAQAALAINQNLIGPLAIRFLSAELPSKQLPSSSEPKTTGTSTTTSSQLTSPADEWICPYCEYDLFYSDDSRFRKAVRSRKKILSRRRRAREKAAATASGQKAAAAAKLPAPALANADETGDLDDEPSPGERTADRRTWGGRVPVPERDRAG